MTFLRLRESKCERFWGMNIYEMSFPGEDLTENSVLVRRNLQFSSTKWAKAYLINYILDKLQESMGNIFILCSLSWIK